MTDLKKRICIMALGLLLYVIIVPCIAFCDSGNDFLPSLDVAFGVSGPRIEKCIQNAEPSPAIDPMTGNNQNGYQITDDDYQAIGKAFANSEYILDSADLSGRSIIIRLSKQSQTVEMHYDLDQYCLFVYYPKYYYEDSEAYGSAQGQSILPDPETVIGAFVPYFGNVLNKTPIRMDHGEESVIVEEYSTFSDEDYTMVSRYLKEKEYELVDYEKDGNVLVIHLEKNGVALTIKYDPDAKKATVIYPDSAFVERRLKLNNDQKTDQKDDSEKTASSGTTKAESILTNKVVKKLISSCPSIAKITKATKDYYSSSADYYKDFPENDAIHTWRIIMQTGVVSFCDEEKMTVLTMVPNGTINQVLPVLSWDIEFYKAIPDIIRDADLNGVKLIIEKRDCKTGDYAAYADSKGMINLLDYHKRSGVLQTAQDSKNLLVTIQSVGDSLGELDTNGNGKIDFDEMFK